jgi:integrase
VAIIFQGRVFTVMAKHLYTRNGAHYYQRRIPQDVAHHYPKRQRTKIVIPLGRISAAHAAREAARLAQQDDDLWATYRGEPNTGVREVRNAAVALLDRYGLKPGDQQRGAADDEIDRMIDAFRDKEIEPDRETYADGDEDVYGKASPEKYLTPVKIEALRQLYGDSRFLASDARELYLSLHDRRTDPKFLSSLKFAFDGLFECIGDLPVHDYRREHANQFRAWMASEGYRTSTIKRRIGVVKAVFNVAIRERELPIANVFQKVRIPDLGKDAVSRKSFTQKELQIITKACRTTDDDLRWIVAFLIDTGARLAEVVGLRISDIHLKGRFPFVDICGNDARGIKTRASTRKVPLVGESLWAAKRVVASAQVGQKYAFPRYAGDEVCKSSSASAAVCKWLRSIGIAKGAHNFRHTIRDRLRDADAPKEIQDAIGGWSRQDIGEQYGEGYALSMLARYLRRMS